MKQIKTPHYITYNGNIGRLKMQIIDWDQMNEYNWIDMCPTAYQVDTLISRYPALNISYIKLVAYIDDNQLADFGSVITLSKTNNEAKSLLDNFMMLYNFCAGDYNARL